MNKEVIIAGVIGLALGYLFAGTLATLPVYSSVASVATGQ